MRFLEENEIHAIRDKRSSDEKRRPTRHAKPRIVRRKVVHLLLLLHRYQMRL